MFFADAHTNMHKILCAESERDQRRSTQTHFGTKPGHTEWRRRRELYTRICYLNLARRREKTSLVNMRNKSHSARSRGSKLRGSRYAIQRICLFGNKFRCILLSLKVFGEHTGNTATGNGNWAAADCFDTVDRQHELSLSRSRLECSTGDGSLRFISIFSLSPFFFFRSFLLRRSNLTQAGSSRFFASDVCPFAQIESIVYLRKHATWPDFRRTQFVFSRPLFGWQRSECSRGQKNTTNTKITFSDRTHLAPAVNFMHVIKTTFGTKDSRAMKRNPKRKTSDVQKNPIECIPDSQSDGCSIRCSHSGLSRCT